MLSFVSAQSRSFPGLEIISRSQRGANESRRYFSEAGYTNRVKRNNAYELRLMGSGVDADGAFAQRQERDEVSDARTTFLQTYYPNDILTDETIRQDGNKQLLRPLSYKKQKTKIVIHHTATNDRWETPSRILSGLQQIYKYHSLTHQRGDIGYNFLIDPLGSLYEGRAGGADIIAAHADRNNVSTVGVSLMGNFDIHQPSLRMRWSMKKLIAGLMIQYQIDLQKKQPYFTPIDEEPRLEVHTHTSLVGHTDTKNTSCPGDHIMERLPGLRRELAEIGETLRDREVKDLKGFKFMPRPLTLRADEDEETITYPLTDRVVRECKLFSKDRELIRCGANGRDLIVQIRRRHTHASGRYPLLVSTDRGALWIDLKTVHQSQLDQLLVDRQHMYPLATPPRELITKLETKIPRDEISTLLDKSVGVLLYTPTTTLDHREFICESDCQIQLDDKRFADIRLIRAQPSATDPTMLDVFLDLKKYSTRSLRLFNLRSVITMTNRDRGTSQTPLNYFRGDIEIRQQSYTTVDKEQKTSRTVVNHLPVSEYLRGIAEATEDQHPEKLRTLALLTKGYMLFYLGGNRHPSVPEGSSYQAIDDPRLFQKYVGAGREPVSPERSRALDATFREVVLFDGYLPILPYFHCSAGFTRSGKERRGWTDTPWLVGQLDVAKCESGEFEGHGVGLSGDGAERLAQAGLTHQQILQRYYAGVQIEKF